jgi:peptidyl-tRNA hydrolase, PTH1 family
LKFVVGIGNPERKYDGTRHNIGFHALDVLRKRLGGRPDVLLIKPDTYVNRTGEAASRLREKHGAALSDFLFVCDDVNLAFGKLRLRGSGSSGGHHGLESVIAAFGSEDFARLRIGVGTEDMPHDLTEFVLEGFTRQEQKELGPVLENAGAVCEAWIAKDLKAATDTLARLQSTQTGSKE